MNPTLNYVFFLTDNIAIFAATIAMLGYMFLFSALDTDTFATYVPGIGAQSAVMASFFGGLLGTAAAKRATQNKH